MGSRHGPQAGCTHRGDVLRRRPDDRPANPPGGPPVTETPNPNIINADTLTGEMRPIRRAVLSLGANLGGLMENLQGAGRALADTPDVWVPGVPPVYETEPVDAPEGSDMFLNAVVLAD